MRRTLIGDRRLHPCDHLPGCEIHPAKVLAGRAIVPRGLAAPVHLHTREDEFSFVLEGRWGFMLGSSAVHAEPGDLAFKPRDVWHAVWDRF